MASKVGIVGKSGSGKTTSLFNLTEFGVLNVGLNPEETVILSPTQKELPVKGGNKLYPSNGASIKDNKYFTNLNPEGMIKIMKAIDENYPNIKNIVIDDAQYLQSLFLMDKAEEKGYDKFTQTALRAYTPIHHVNNLKRKDLVVIFIYHVEKDDNQNEQIKTSGKMVESTLGGLDGLFTTLLYSECKMDYVENKVVYIFHTHSNGRNTCKTPLGMFKDDTIPNDLGFVVKTIREFYS